MRGRHNSFRHERDKLHRTYANKDTRAAAPQGKTSCPNLFCVSRITNKIFVKIYFICFIPQEIGMHYMNSPRNFRALARSDTLKLTAVAVIFSLALSACGGGGGNDDVTGNGGTSGNATTTGTGSENTTTGTTTTGTTGTSGNGTGSGGASSGTGTSQTSYTVTPSVSGGTGGTISPAAAVPVNAGATATFTLTPSTGYTVDSVGGTCGGTLNGNTYTTNAVTTDCTVVASFTQAANSNTSSADCYNANDLRAGTVLDEQISSVGTDGTVTSNHTVRTTGVREPFAGVNPVALHTTQTFDLTDREVSVVTTVYVDSVNGNMVNYGSTSSSGTIISTPPRSIPISMQPGQSLTLTSTDSVSSTVEVYTYNGRETLQTDMGTFQTCKFTDDSTTTLNSGGTTTGTGQSWVAAEGPYQGQTLKQVSEIQTDTVTSMTYTPGP
jgi:hypothetical protein